MKKSEEFWDKISEKYDKRAEKFDKTYSKAIKNTRKYLKKNDRVLDFACGTGIVAYKLADSVKKIQGIDTSSGMIRIAKRKAKSNTHFIKSSLFDKNLGTFDVILAFNILHLVDDVQKVTRRIHKLLKPSGLFISITPSLGERFFFSLLLRFLHKIGRVPYVRNFKIVELKEIIAKNFQIVEIKQLSQTPPSYFIVAKKK